MLCASCKFHPLHDPPESPDKPQPITPQHLITQRDDACKELYNIPPKYNEQDLLAYEANRSKRIEALAD